MSALHDIDHADVKGSDHQDIYGEYIRTFLAHQYCDEGEFVSDGELAALLRESLSEPANPERQLRALGRLSQTDDFAGDPEVNNRFGYRGYWYEPEIGKYLCRNRVYDPRFGRWLTRDPIGYAGGWNLYRYCEGRPSGRYDPMGLEGVGFFEFIGYFLGAGPDGAAGAI